MEHGPRGHKKSKNSEQFQKCIQKPQRDDGRERPGRLRKEYQLAAGPHPEPEALPGPLDVTKQEQEQIPGTGNWSLCTVSVSDTFRMAAI